MAPAVVAERFSRDRDRRLEDRSASAATAAGSSSGGPCSREAGGTWDEDEAGANETKLSSWGNEQVVQ